MMDRDSTMDRLNIVRKLALNLLKLIEVGSKPLSLKKKRFAIGTDPEKNPEKTMNYVPIKAPQS